MHYESHFGLTKAPFSISPDPSFLYLTQGHQEALAHLLYGIKSQGGFVLLTGEIGAGKTTVCRCLLEQLPDNVEVALVLNPLLNEIEFLAAICDELGIFYPDISVGIKGFMDRLQEYLLEAHGQGMDVVLIVDEAQNLSRNVMEQLRLLTNLETSQKKLLQIILIGQPELRDFINQPELRQMAQRITARYHLGALSSREVEAYIQHRLTVAGYAGYSKPNLFAKDSMRFIARASGGVPRLINILCDRALLGAYLSNASVVSIGYCKVAAKEVLSDRGVINQYVLSSVLRWLAPVVILLLVGFALSFFFRREGLPVPGDVSLDPGFSDPGFSDHSSAKSAPIQLVEPVAVKPAGSRGLSATNELTVPQAVNLKSGERTELFTSQAESSESTTPSTAQAKDVVLPDPKLVGSVDEQVEPEPASADAVDRSIVVNKKSLREEMAKLLSSTSFSALEQQAFNTVFSRWDRIGQPRSGMAPCAFARHSGLRCFFGNGDLALLLSLNRPVVLTLHDRRGDKIPAVLLDVTESDVVLKLAGVVGTFPLLEFGSRWPGDFILVWRPPTGFTKPIRYGDQGTVVTWLLQQLGETIVGTEVAVYDEQRVGKVRSFQSNNGLIADGVAGPLTLIALQNTAGDAMPGLRANKETRAMAAANTLPDSRDRKDRNQVNTNVPIDMSGQ